MRHSLWRPANYERKEKLLRFFLNKDQVHYLVIINLHKQVFGGIQCGVGPRTRLLPVPIQIETHQGAPENIHQKVPD